MTNYYENSLNYLKEKFTVRSFPLNLFPDFHIEEGDITLFVVLEKTIGYIESNSDRLFCELVISMKPTKSDLSN